MRLESMVGGPIILTAITAEPYSSMNSRYVGWVEVSARLAAQFRTLIVMTSSLTLASGSGSGTYFLGFWVRADRYAIYTGYG